MFGNHKNKLTMKCLSHEYILLPRHLMAGFFSGHQSSPICLFSELCYSGKCRNIIN